MIGIGAQELLLLALLALGALVVGGILYFALRNKDKGRHNCPVCAEPMDKGETVCAHCGHREGAAIPNPPME